jgi:geranylgeranyl reductase family protein
LYLRIALYDLIVIGAGPAGASAARVAAKKGLRTLLVEKEKVPRHKLCGGGVTPKVLRRLDFTLPKELIECETRATRIHVGGNCFPFETGRPIAYMTSRAPFDAFLTDKAKDAGTELVDQSPAQRIARTGSYVEVKTPGRTFQAKMIIGADGMGGPTASAGNLYEHWKPNEVLYALETEVQVGEGAVQDFIGDSAYFDLYFGVSRAGYGWVFPKDDHLTVGVGCRLSALRDAQGLFKGFLKQVPELIGREIPKPQAHLIPIGGAAKVPTVNDRMLLAGDSAGHAEPLFGEGIYFSIVGGQIAAEVASEACQTEQYNREFLRIYQERVTEEFGKDFDIAYDVARFSYLENYDMERVARFFFGEKKFQESMVGLMEGTLRYRDVKRKVAWPFFKYQLSKLGLPFST